MSRQLPPCPLCQKPLDESLEGFTGTWVHHAHPSGEGLVQSRDRFVACGTCVALVRVTATHEDASRVIAETAVVEIQPASATRALEILDEAARSERLWEALHGLKPRESLLLPVVFRKVARLFEDPIVLREDAYLMDPLVRESRIRSLQLAADVDAQRAKPGYSIIREADFVKAGTPVTVLEHGPGCIHARHFHESATGGGYIRVPAWAVAPAA